MKKKIIIGLLVVGAIAGAVYLYKKNKANKVQMATKEDAYKIIDILGKKDSAPSADMTEAYAQKYISAISKDEHKKLLVALNKKENEWTSEEKVLVNKMIKAIKS